MSTSRLVRRAGALACVLGASLGLAGACVSGGSEPVSTDPIEPFAASPFATRVDLASTQPIVARGDAFVAELAPGTAAALRAHIPARADRPVRFDVGGHPVWALREGARPAPAELREGAVVVPGAVRGVDALWLRAEMALEELWAVAEDHDPLAYRLVLPTGWALEAEEGPSARVVDGEGRVRLHITAPRAFDAEGEPVPVAVTVAGDRLGFEVEATAWPVVVDPAWLAGSAPAQLRSNHTASLLGDGTVLFAGGRNGSMVLSSLERYDPVRNTSSIVATLTPPRDGHTATVLGGERVLIVGGETGAEDLDSVVFYDPADDSLSDGPPMAAARSGHAAVRLLDGRVLVVGGGPADAEIFDPVGGTWQGPIGSQPAFTTVAAAVLPDGRVFAAGTTGSGPRGAVFDPTTDTFGSEIVLDAGIDLVGHNAVPFLDGKVALLGGGPCATSGGPVTCNRGLQIYDSVSGLFSGGLSTYDRIQAGATLLPSGRALFAGASDFVPTPETLSGETLTSSGTFALLPGTFQAEHADATTTVLASGDVLVLGGEQAATELLVGEGAAFAPGPTMSLGRWRHTATRLDDGTVLLAGGETDVAGITSGAERYDPSDDSMVATGAMATGRQGHAAVRLDDGQVLVIGGSTTGLTGLASAELYDPQSGTFSETGVMAETRYLPAAELLLDGRVLVVGGRESAGQFAPTRDTAEVFDPTTGTFAPVSNTLSEAGDDLAARVLPTGEVLVLQRQSADLYDPESNSFVPVASPGATYTTPRLSWLLDGRILATGGGTFAAEIFDPASQSFSFTGLEARVRIQHTTTTLPGGGVLLVGGKELGAQPAVWSNAGVYATAGESFGEVPLAASRRRHTTTLLADGRALVAGGKECDGNAICFPLATTELWIPPGWSGPAEPQLDQAPASVAPDEAFDITGTQLVGLTLSSGTGATSSARPLVCWQPRGRDVVIPGRVVAFEATKVTAVFPATTFAGPGALRVIVNGVASAAVPLELQAAPNGAGCVFAEDCPSGFCVDGVCCDTACTGDCEGCTAALKGSGADGICGAVPPERFPDDACALTDGAPCTDPAQCETGFCADGVCCNAACGAQCEACDVDGSVGVCVPVSGAPRGDRPPCEDPLPPDLCTAAVCDGVERGQCAGAVGPCDPYACGYPACLTACESDDECAVGNRCEDGECVAGRCVDNVATLPNGEQIDCAPYVCQADGSCKTTCADVNDCVAPFACNFEGRCVTRPPNDELASDCGCRTVGAGSARNGHAWWLLLGALVAFARRRRRVAALALGLAIVLAPALAGAQPAADPSGPTEEAEAPEASAVAEPAPATPVGDAAKRTEAKERFKRGLGHSRAERWAEALAEFLASRALFPTRVATNNAAIAYRELQRYAEALAMYEALMREFADMPVEDMDRVQATVTELRTRVGSIEIDLAEPGATIVIDGTTRGTYPPPGPLRVSAGQHIVRIVKDGFEPFETRVTVAGAAIEHVKAPMTALRQSGRLLVKEAQGRAVDVLVDDVVVGQTPWEGRVSVGKHTVRLSGEGGLGTAPVPAPVESQETTSLTLEAVTLDAHLRVEPVPATAVVSLDSVELGRGVWEGAVPSGEHVVEVRADGFLPDKRTITLNRDSAVVPVILERREEGVTIPGDFVVDVVGAGMITPTFGGDIASDCEAGCNQQVGLGAAARLHVGYELPIGFGFGAHGGFLVASQEVQGRAATVQPVGFEARAGTASDSVRVRGPFVGGWISWLFDDEDFPILVRLGAGPLFGRVLDQRTGSFSLADGTAYQAGPIVQEPSAIYMTVMPEGRFGLRIHEHVVLSLGVEVPILIALERPRWDSTREVDAEVDGIGAYETEALTGQALAFGALSLGARAQF